MNKILLFILFSLMPHLVISQVQLHWDKVLNRQTIAIALNPLDDHKVYVTSDNDFLVSTNAGETWQARSTNIPEDCHNIAISPFDTSLIVIYADGNLLRSIDGGFIWNVVLSGVSMNGETIDFHPTQADSVFYVDFSSGTLWVSADRGKSWNVRTTIAGLNAVCSFAINPHDPRQMLAGAAFSNVMISLDGGFTWDEVKDPTPEFTEVPKIVWDALNPGWAYGSVYNDPRNSFIRVGDKGNNWSYEGLLFIDTWALDIDPIKGDIYLGTFSENRYPGFFKSYDLGKSWQRFGDTPVDIIWQLKTASDTLVYAASLGFPAAVYRLKINQQFGYISGTVTDSASGTPVDYFEIDIPASSDKIIASNSNGIYKMALPAGSYSIKYSYGPIRKNVYDIAVQPGETQTLDILLDLNIKYLTLAGKISGEQGEPLNSLVTLNYIKATTENVTRSVYTDNDGFYHFDSLSSLNQFTRLNIEPMVFPYMGMESNEFAIDTLQDFSLQYADIIIANDSDNPNNTDLYKQALAKNDLTAIATSSTTHPQNLAPNIIVLTRTNALILLTDKDQRQSSALDKMQLLANAGSHIIMSGQNLLENNANLVSETEPFSHSFFSDLNIQFAGNYEIAGFADPMHGFAANPIGNDLSLTIRLTNQESPDILSSNNDSVLKAFYYGDTAIDTLNIAGVSVSNTGKGGKAVILGFDLHYQSPALLSEILKRSIDYFDGVINSIGKTFVTSPKDYELYQNYPNPFNPQTNIKFYLPTADKVKLQVYDISGRKIKTLISNMEMVPGWHLTQWNGKTETGYDAASGVYFYTLDGNHFSQSRKMLLIR